MKREAIFVGWIVSWELAKNYGSTQFSGQLFARQAAGERSGAGSRVKLIVTNSYFSRADIWAKATIGQVVGIVYF